MLPLKETPSPMKTLFCLLLGFMGQLPVKE
jgi:hypothetical protein